MKRAFALVGALAVFAGSATAQQPSPHRPYRREVPQRLLAHAKVSEDSALKIAQARMPGARVQAVELEHERGHLIWSWELKLEGKTGIEEVNVDAGDGSIVGVEHEEPAGGH